MRNGLLRSVAATTLALLPMGGAHALVEGQGVQYAAPDDVIQRRTAEVERRYAPRLAQLRRDGESIGDDRPSDLGAALGIDVKIGSHRENVILNVPEFKMGLQRIVLTVPEFWMGRQRLVFGTPSVRMERVQVGVHPEWFGPFHMEWKANYMDMPKTFMQEQVVVLDLPQVKMGDQEILLHLPEVSMREQRWSFDVPDVTVVDVHAKVEKMRSAGVDLQARGADLANGMRTEISQILVEELPRKRAEAVGEFDRGEAQIVSAIEQARKVNVDTSKPFPDGKPGLDEALRIFQDARRAALAKIDEQIAKAGSSRT